MAVEGEPTDRAAARAGETLLSGAGLTRTFGGIKAVIDMEFSIRRGEITGLIGPNGAGKSTLFNLVSGVDTPQQGSVAFKGRNISGLAPYQRARVGMIRTFQLAREFGSLTVLENLMLSPQLQMGENFLPLFLRPEKIREQDDAIYRRALEVLEISRLAPLRDEYAANLSGGQKKLLELARTLMIECEAILLDEPGAGVNPALMTALRDMIIEMNRNHGKTFFIVEHDMDLIAKLCDTVIVMTEGRKLTQGTFDEVRADDRVIQAYLGGGIGHE